MKKSAWAWARSPAPKARAIEALMPPPMAPEDIIWHNIKTGKTKAIAARACVPRRLTNQVSANPASNCAKMTRVLGIANRISVGAIGSCNSCRVLGSKGRSQEMALVHLSPFVAFESDGFGA